MDRTPAPERHVLVVEDDRFQRRAAEVKLRRCGFRVSSAVDGEEALRVAAEGRPDIILLDLIMPKLSGFEVLARLKADPATAAIPVLVLSNLGQQPDVDRAMRGGAAGYFVKSKLSLSELVARVIEVLADPKGAGPCQTSA
jgi:CheY-like chemotaxis protein